MSIFTISLMFTIPLRLLYVFILITFYMYFYMFFKSENPVFDDMIQVSDYLTSTKILKSCDEFDFRDQHTEGDIRNCQ